MKKIVAFLILLITVSPFFEAHAQNAGTAISGTVIDESGDPILGVNIIVEGTSVGTTSDFDGNYTIKLPENGTILKFSYIGYGTQSVTVNGRTTINVTMITDSSGLDEIVVVAYGTQKKEAITSSVVTVKSKELKDITTPNVSSMLQGKVAGVQIAASSGAPGATPNILIRGAASLGGRITPLWVVDGVPINAFQPPPARDAAPSPTMAGAGPIPNEIASLNTEDIERMEILKGGKAAIFGGRGNNGVILIYTKIGGNNYKKIISPEFTINGITNKREFYIPKYNVKKSSSHFYPTLYWNPNIQTDKNGNATFTFINHSNTNQVQIAIDALTNYGIPGSYLKTITNK